MKAFIFEKHTGDVDGLLTELRKGGGLVLSVGSDPKRTYIYVDDHSPPPPAGKAYYWRECSDSRCPSKGSARFHSHRQKASVTTADRSFSAPAENRRLRSLLSGKRVAKLTAVVLCYNKADKIKKCWGSLMDQVRRPDEVIMVDDCSTDKPAAYYREIVAPFTYIRLPKNRGQGHARNVGAKHARCDFIIFLDGDIVMKPSMLQRLERALVEDPGCSISYSHYARVGTRTDHVRALPWDRDLLRRENYITMMSLIRFKDMPAPPFDEKLARYEDWDLWLRMANRGHKGIMVPDILFSAHYKKGDLSSVGESDSWYHTVRARYRLR